MTIFKKNQNRWKAIILDLDGTLLHSGNRCNEKWWDKSKTFGLLCYGVAGKLFTTFELYKYIHLYKYSILPMTIIVSICGNINN